MKYTHCVTLTLLLAAYLLLLPPPCEARGGRGRGGGSFGGLFGGWRSKYGSKSSSSGGGRRVLSGSPVHTAMPMPKPPPPPPPQVKPMNMPKPQAGGYPRQQLPQGQGMFYSNAQALPHGAVYYAQPPTSMLGGSGMNGFLTGMLAGRLMDSVLFGHRHHHGSHVYQQNQQVQTEAAAGSGRDIVIINNGQGEQQQAQSTNHAAEQTKLEENSAAEAAPPVGGLMCFPIMLNETDANNSNLMVEVERIVCIPAPAPAPELKPEDCQGDLQCLLEQSLDISTTEPPIVAGDIGGAAEEHAEQLEVTTLLPVVAAD
ncbi:CG31706 [Drosophila busckii]|uniref:CG31706 n=1 Tax=Drosophila busckii TaxID=30019 RepID=A0A0M4EPR9_DROBS|nr:CG31706 [Drosophila busckii]